jgi:hypothetical protein
MILTRHKKLYKKIRKTNKYKNGGAKLTPKLKNKSNMTKLINYLDDVAFNKQKPSFNEQMNFIRPLVESIPVAFTNEYGKTVLDMLLLRSKYYFDYELLKNTIDRVIAADLTYYVTYITINHAVRGFEPYNINTEQKKDILNMLMNIATGRGSGSIKHNRFAKNELVEMLRNAEIFNNYGIPEILFERGYNIQNLIDYVPIYENSSAEKIELVNKYNKTVELIKTAPTIYAFQKAANSYMDMESVESLVNYLK